MTSSQVSRLVSLADAVRFYTEQASTPGTHPTVYRRATRLAVYFTRQLVREWTAIQWRDDLKKSAELHPVSPSTDHGRKFYGTPGTYTGD